ncbi:MAG: hypothetical protein ABJC13_17255 [Acidobacteriota bacterium]
MQFHAYHEGRYLEIAVAARSNHEVWVVNHLLDSVSIIELDEHGGELSGEVERTLLVGDEPRALVFAAFAKFNGAFPDRLGRSTVLSQADKGRNVRKP